ncbi:hypothetical protein FVEN_g7757 [Fusarium venenatum]|uniref:Uncharacterized protein n=1 Tax=Fusarium venenatum TaxID=56646 RepID=A0A2L2TZR9_9HYPO|nr:uncharacterized protein FVRRES_08047 [Fusarium venenatum]KAG8354307.1 hypothetical protein FVEN_g7757 [Fusarium venenatum]KAH6964834.1 hypothetical protein EDB82DRAFT_511078 [Fusarium venenatum]CEI67970.1 unnamed protein product [Fusarium venenatum]
MSAFRVTNSRSFLALRPVIAHSTINSRVPQVVQRSTFATQGYGDNEGDPVGSKEPNSRATHEAEHPGPTPPAGKTKQNETGKSPEDASAQSGGSRSKDAIEKGKSPTAGSIGGKE